MVDGQQELGEKVLVALESLLRRDGALLTRNVGERAITAALREHLRPQFRGWHVDCEYNRDGQAVKMLSGKKVFPDLIVHRRGQKKNLLVIEAKKSNSKISDQIDIDKLLAFREQLGYEAGLFIKFTVGEAGPGIARIVWV